MKDISQYYSIMNSPSRSKANIGFLKTNNRAENIVTCNPQLRSNLEYRDVINYSTSNYLGLGQNKQVKKDIIDALEKYGSGANGSPILSGYYTVHTELEQALSDFHGYEDTLLTSSGFVANFMLLTSLFSKGDTVFLEAHTHGSIVMGARLSGANVKIYSENNTTDLDRIVSKCSSKKKLIITCGVFSMSGKISNLPEITKIAKKYQCLLAVDDAHGLGVIGRNGRGTTEFHGLSAQDVDIHIGTLSKSLSASGGYISAKKTVIKYLRLKGMPYILSASLPPMVVAGALSALTILTQEGEKLTDNLRDKITFFKSTLILKGF